MDYYWKDIYNHKEEWEALEIKFTNPVVPAIRLLSGNNMRMKLVKDDQTLFWATISKDFWDISVIRTFEETARSIGNISSHEIEKRKDLTPEEKYKSWSRYFTEELIKNDNHFLYNSLWILKGYKTNTRSLQYSCIYIEEDNSAIIHTGEWDWSLLFSRQVDKDSGRMKWWRKKARENSLPPVLAWFIPSIGDYWIIDGNYRLQAALLEKKSISVIAAYSGYYKNNIIDPEKQKSMIKSAREALKNKDKLTPKSITGINNALLQAFDDRPVFTEQTFAKSKIKSDSEWIKEVCNYLKEINYPDWEKEMEYLIQRK